MPGTLQVGGNTVITHTGDAGAGTNTINNAVVFPAGHIVQTVFNTHSAESSFTSTTPTAVANLTKPITLKTDNPYVLVILAINSIGKFNGNTAMVSKITANDSGSLDIILSDMTGYNSATNHNFFPGNQSYLHNLTNDAAGTTITYTPKFYLSVASGTGFINASSGSGLKYSQIILMEIQK